MREPNLRTALVSTPGNFEIAQRLIDRSLHGLTITHYFKRGGVCQKRISQDAPAHQVTLGRLAMIKDIRAERFEQVFVVEFPLGRTNVLPFYALVAILSKAPGRFVVGEDGRLTPITVQSVVKLMITYSGMILRYSALVPLLIANFTLLIAGSVVVDAILSMKSRRRDAPRNAAQAVSKRI
jgi:hypothetical protein